MVSYESSSFFKQIDEKHVSNEVKLMLWNPKMDLIALAFANADIYLDDSWRFVWTTELHDICLALLRWEDGAEPSLYGPRSDSQDTWVLHSDSVLDRKWNLEQFKIIN